jgi:hypothetical protein
MNKIIRIALLFVVLGVGVISSASTQSTTKASGVEEQTLIGCPKPIPVCIPEKYFDYTVCRCVSRP